MASRGRQEQAGAGKVTIATKKPAGSAEADGNAAGPCRPKIYMNDEVLYRVTRKKTYLDII